MTKKKKDEIRIQQNLQNISNYAKKLGIEAIVNGYPIFRGSESFLLKHIDDEKLYEKANEIYSSLIENNIPKDRAGEYIKKEIVDYIESGEILDEKGKEIILEVGLKEQPKSLFQKVSSYFKPQSKGLRELGKSMEAFQEIYNFYKTGDYQKSMPELDKPFRELEKSKFLYATASIMQAYGNKEIADYLKEAGYKKYEKSSKEITSGLEKIAASVFGVLGLGMMMFNLGLTGAVIETATKMTNNIVGAIFILISIGLFLIKKL